MRKFVVNFSWVVALTNRLFSFFQFDLIGIGVFRRGNPVFLFIGLSFTAAFSATACKKSSLSGGDLPRGFGFASE